MKKTKFNIMDWSLIVGILVVIFLPVVSPVYCLATSIVRARDSKTRTLKLAANSYKMGLFECWARWKGNLI